MIADYNLIAFSRNDVLTIDPVGPFAVNLPEKMSPV